MHLRDRATGEKSTAALLVGHLGEGSPAWERAASDWPALLASDPRAQASLEEWRALHAQFAAAPPSEDLFLRHTYLACVARCVAAIACSPLSLQAQKTGLPARVSDPDVFSWPDSSGPADLIRSALLRADLADVEGDILKPLHHALTSPRARRSLGELYTPDWLAQWMVDDLLRTGPGRIIDPACGSGTFLLFAIRRLRARLPDSADSLEAILSRVHGADVNPLAVELARANYLLALGPLLRHATSPIEAPVRVLDTLAVADWQPRYDLVIGNPPWIPLRSLPPARQAATRRLASHYGLAEGRGEMATHLEAASLFLLHCADAALAPEGRVSFVLPRTLFTAEQHHQLRTGRVHLPASPGCRLCVEHVVDCEAVTPLFRTPAAVLTCRKSTAGAADSIPLIRLAGRLPSRDLPLGEVMPLLARTETLLHLHRAGGRSWWSAAVAPAPSKHAASPYKARFRQGATLVPRSFWFVDIEDHDDDRMVRIVSSPASKGGPVASYRGLTLRGVVESECLFTTLLGDDLLPFAPRRFRTIVLPAAPGEGTIVPVDSGELERCGRAGMAAWMREAERSWGEIRGDKAAGMTLPQRLDHVRGLSAQRVSARWRVLYPNFQRTGAACVVDSQCIRGAGHPTRFVVDTALYACETDDEGEAHYLCAMLNSRPLDDRLQPLRRRDQAAHPNVHKKVFDVAPIPRFNSCDALHFRLAELGADCRLRIERRIALGDPSLLGTLAGARRSAREIVEEQRTEIDSLAAELFAREPRISE